METKKIGIIRGLALTRVREGIRAIEDIRKTIERQGLPENEEVALRLLRLKEIERRLKTDNGFQVLYRDIILATAIFTVPLAAFAFNAVALHDYDKHLDWLKRIEHWEAMNGMEPLKIAASTSSDTITRWIHAITHYNNPNVSLPINTIAAAVTALVLGVVFMRRFANSAIKFHNNKISERELKLEYSIMRDKTDKRIVNVLNKEAVKP